MRKLSQTEELVKILAGRARRHTLTPEQISRAMDEQEYDVSGLDALYAALITAWLTALGGGIIRDVMLGSLPPVGVADVVERDADGRPLRAVGTHVDLTARKAMELELRAARDTAEAASRAKSTFLGNMSHELRTPMNGIMGLTRLALRRADDPKQRDLLDKIDQSSRQLLGLINDVLEISNIESQRITLDETDFSIAGLLSRLHAEIGAQAVDKGLTLQLTQPPAITALALRGDEKRLRQILKNRQKPVLSLNSEDFEYDTNAEFGRRTRAKPTVKSLPTLTLPQIVDAIYADTDALQQAATLNAREGVPKPKGRRHF